jgi:hypothetical protein
LKLGWSSALNSMVASGAAATQRRCAYPVPIGTAGNSRRSQAHANLRSPACASGTSGRNGAAGPGVRSSMKGRRFKIEPLLGRLERHQQVGRLVLQEVQDHFLAGCLNCSTSLPWMPRY